MRLGRRLSAGIAEDPPAPTPIVEAPAETVEAGAPAVETPAPERTPDPAVSGS